MPTPGMAPGRAFRSAGGEQQRASVIADTQGEPHDPFIRCAISQVKDRLIPLVRMDFIRLAGNELI